MEELSGSTLLITLAVILCVANAISAVWKGIESWKKITKADQREARELAQDKAIGDLNARMTRCEERLTKGDLQFDGIRADMTQVLLVMSAELTHFMSGNDHTKLREIKDQLDAYLAKR